MAGRGRPGGTGHLRGLGGWADRLPLALDSRHPEVLRVRARGCDRLPPPDGGRPLFSAFGAGHGLGFDSGPLGLALGVAGILLGACLLAVEFQPVEGGIAYGAPREESWPAAFGLTSTPVWIYLEALRVLTILNNDNWRRRQARRHPPGTPGPDWRTGAARLAWRDANRPT
ncbi:Bax inhibitor-1/YccA family protein [Streptomyces sp. NPDC049954]|uniref:Bax inhibitor-1/YccA family membrane protein n=1 Tax=Streptomyces sp. NPDC049954 TaxID=3155779 RepID=UPI0034341A50